MMTFPPAERTPRRRRWAWLAALALLGAAVWYASLPAPLGPAGGVALEGHVTRMPDATAGSRRTLRVGAFNIHGCKGPDNRRDVARVAKCLEGLDFVALSEVHGPHLWQKLDQAGELGEQLGMAWLFAPNTRVWRHLDSGNGLLSALPVASWQRIPLANYGGRGSRNAVLVDLKHGDRTVHVVLTHIARGVDRERQEQLRTVLALYLALGEPALLLGDLNSDASDPQIHQLLATPGVVDAVGKILGGKDTPRIDWIVARGLRLLDAGTRDNGASDHPAVWAEFE
jgi:endonuclease/exonuclease/phosphatase family metal-dependent hydrolase